MKTDQSVKKPATYDVTYLRGGATGPATEITIKVPVGMAPPKHPGLPPQLRG